MCSQLIHSGAHPQCTQAAQLSSLCLDLEMVSVKMAVLKSFGLRGLQMMDDNEYFRTKVDNSEDTVMSY